MSKEKESAIPAFQDLDEMIASKSLEEMKDLIKQVAFDKGLKFSKDQKQNEEYIKQWEEFVGAMTEEQLKNHYKQSYINQIIDKHTRRVRAWPDNHLNNEPLEVKDFSDQEFLEEVSDMLITVAPLKALGMAGNQIGLKYDIIGVINKDESEFEIYVNLRIPSFEDPEYIREYKPSNKTFSRPEACFSVPQKIRVAANKTKNVYTKPIEVKRYRSIVACYQDITGKMHKIECGAEFPELNDQEYSDLLGQLHEEMKKATEKLIREGKTSTDNETFTVNFKGKDYIFDPDLRRSIALCRVLQHERDHQKGKTILDHMTGILGPKMAKDKLRKNHQRVSRFFNGKLPR